MKPRGRSRRAVALFCVTLVVFAAVAPVAATLLPAVLTPLWLVVPAVVVTLVRRRAARRPVQPVPLLSASLLRAPPLASLS